MVSSMKLLIEKNLIDRHRNALTPDSPQQKEGKRERLGIFCLEDSASE